MFFKVLKSYLVQQVKITDADKLFSNEIESNNFSKLLVHRLVSGGCVLANCDERISDERQEVARTRREVRRILAAVDQPVEKNQKDGDQNEVPHPQAKSN